MRLHVFSCLATHDHAGLVAAGGRRRPLSLQRAVKQTLWTLAFILVLLKDMVGQYLWWDGGSWDIENLGEGQTS